MIDEFKSAVNSAVSRPKGVKVSPELWTQLNKLGLIEQKNIGIGGVIKLGFELPFYDNDIYTIYDPALPLGGNHFTLP